jgi:hypothetical protein
VYSVISTHAFRERRGEAVLRVKLLLTSLSVYISAEDGHVLLDSRPTLVHDAHEWFPVLV